MSSEASAPSEASEISEISEAREATLSKPSSARSAFSKFLKTYAREDAGYISLPPPSSATDHNTEIVLLPWDKIVAANFSGKGIKAWSKDPRGSFRMLLLPNKRVVRYYRSKAGARLTSDFLIKSGTDQTSANLCAAKQVTVLLGLLTDY